MKHAAILLAGGLGRRMGGGDKSLKMLAGRPLLSHVIMRIQPQVSVMALNANGDPARFAEFGLAVIADFIPGLPGPLAGIHAGMKWAQENFPEISHILSIPTDLPFLPLNLVSKLQETLLETGAEIAITSSGGQRQPLVGLWPVTMAETLHRDITQENMRKAGDFVDRHQAKLADFPIDPIDPFYNINSPDDYTQAELFLRMALSGIVAPNAKSSFD